MIKVIPKSDVIWIINNFIIRIKR